jgi:hypothetical protein
METERKKQILMDIIPTDVENSKEILDAITEPDDEKCLRIFYQKIIEGSKYTRGFKTVGDSILKQLGDKEWTAKVYQMAVSKAESSDDYIEIAHSYVYYLKDCKTADELSQKAAEIAKSTCEYIRVAEFEVNYLDDRSNLTDYYAKAKQLLEDDITDKYELGISMFTYIKDWEEGAELIREAVADTDIVDILCNIYSKLEVANIGKEDSNGILREDLLCEIEEKAFDEASDVEDYLYIAASINDSAFKNAISNAYSADDYLLIAEYMQNNGKDPSDILQQAFEELEINDPEDVAKIKEAMK